MLHRLALSPASLRLEQREGIERMAAPQPGGITGLQGGNLVDIPVDEGEPHRRQNAVQRIVFDIIELGIHLHPAPGESRGQVPAPVADERRESPLVRFVDRDVVSHEKVDSLELVFPARAPENLHLEPRFLQRSGDIEGENQPGNGL
ncbi:MAG TPA: hypothetical protein VIV61_04530 [Candidatus Ozemobacteraceae bacterium]